MFFLGNAFIGAIVYVSAAIATLRAGSRLLYILNHGDIGVMNGPLILGPSDNSLHSTSTQLNFTVVNATCENETSALWECTFAFQQAVRLSLSNQEAFIYNNDLQIGLQDSLVQGVPNAVNSTRLDWSTKKDLIKRGFRLRLLNELIKGDITNMRTNSDVSLHQTLNSWYHFWVDPLILGILKITTFPTTSQRKHEEQPRWKKNINKRKWDYEEVTESVVHLNIPSHPRDIKIKSSARIARVKAYSPKVFYDLRCRFGITPSSFVRSIFSSGPFVSFQSNSKGASRSGGFFFFTRDGMFMVKTIKAAEMESLTQRMMPKYHRYMMRNSKKSLLTRFCGVYGVQLLNMEESKSQQKTKEKEKEQFFLIMNSVFPVEGSKFITERFDIKGSTVGRTCSEEEIKTKKTLAVFKDLDLIHEREKYYREGEDRRHRWKTGIEFGERVKSSLLDQLRHDVGLLMSCDVMDYSLLMGIVVLDEGQKPTRNNLTLAKSSFATDPLRVVTSPLLYIGDIIVSAGGKLLSSVLTFPFPYYGADLCGVDCGMLSRIEGRRHGKRAIFYLGVIDFLQPWTTQKVIEREMKGLIGYNKLLISCVHPRLYASRFLDFVDSNIS